MPLPKKRINVELYLSLSAVFLSLAALIVSIVQTKIARDQQHASVWPYLQILKETSNQQLHYGLENKGVGPAIIRSYALSYKGKLYPSLQTLFWEQAGKRTSVASGFGLIGPGYVFKSGENLELLYVANNDFVMRRIEAMLADTSFHMRIHYADVYSNCWLLDQNKVTELGQCSN